MRSLRQLLGLVVALTTLSATAHAECAPLAEIIGNHHLDSNKELQLWCGNASARELPARFERRFRLRLGGTLAMVLGGAAFYAGLFGAIFSVVPSDSEDSVINRTGLGISIGAMTIGTASLITGAVLFSLGNDQIRPTPLNASAPTLNFQF